MDRYHYANSEPPQLSLLDVPQPVLEGGLADMHPRPLVARTKRPGEAFTSFRVPANRAWEWDEVEYARTPTSYTALVVDLDGEGSRNRVCGAVLAKAVQTPSWIVERPSSGGVHAVWALQTPVHRYPHAKRSPLDYLARIGDFYNEELDGDRGYTGVLAHNPESPTYETEYFAGSWSLEELAQFIPLGWRRPRAGAASRRRASGSRRPLGTPPRWNMRRGGTAVGRHARALRLQPAPRRHRPQSTPLQLGAIGTSGPERN